MRLFVYVCPKGPYMRYFAELSYHGGPFFGWQKQPNQMSVQEAIEQGMSTILGSPIELTGCGRTDTGVHARQYFAHFDFLGEFPEQFLRRLNKFLPAAIAFRRIFPVGPEAHARYDAVSRSYVYQIDLQKNPFRGDMAYHFPFFGQLDPNLLQPAADLLLEYEEFYPFCKSNTDTKTNRCQLSRVAWEYAPHEQTLTFHISADRFLRGMVRLIVGMCLNVGLGKQSLEDVRTALDHQTRLTRSWSVPPQGLFLTDIRYPYV